MFDKHNTKKNKMQVRRVVRVKPRELELLKGLFELPGTKSDFQSKYRMQRQSVARILKLGQGTERIVNAMREYYKVNK